MVNIVLDTNTWIYLANGYDQNTQNYQGGLHFKLLAEIKELIEMGKIRLFTNETILIEWERNKLATEKQIISKKGAIEGMRSQFEGAKKVLSEYWRNQANDVFNAYKETVSREIEQHTQHIAAVENLIKNITVKIPINDDIYIVAGKLQVAKKAPFHNKNNSMGDAIILLSAVDYFKNSSYDWIGNTIFVSNNSDDYSAKKGSKEIHPDLLPYFKEADIQFELNIAKALNLSKEISSQIDEFLYYQSNREPCLANCKGEIYGTNVIVYEKLKLYSEGTELLHFNPNQLMLFQGIEYGLTHEEIDAMNDKNSIIIGIGECEHCNALHIRCDCGEEHYSYSDLYHIDCSCGKEYFNNEEGKIKVIVN